ncbi:polysaccharide biosynthesis/export family protein [Anianabacter salinae]|uniref:polysaccharide biosynthesis/export family protein n=1 Tax=Anianabacter salinae TaxID=2851023 RepID=UPI00225E0048|nr:polysaccharide biosynthesis/export family protein [Anianabacter salinae]MBV0912822.1 polysaccharide biosynthesis/export family protein [Anianabacter salinae]
MKIQSSRWARTLAVFLLVATAASCGLPRSGPTKREIYSGSVQREGDSFVVTVNDRVTRATAVIPAFGFSQAFLGAGVLGSDTIRPGDTLGLTIYENVDDGLLASQGVNATVLDEVQVDGAGFIFVPYAGRIRAAGNSPDEIRRLITERLAEQTPDPQVLVRRLAGDGSTVSVSGAVGGQGIYAIERPTRTLSAMLARAGGVVVDPSIAQVQISRGARQETVWYQDLYEHPQFDIALRGGDRILVKEDSRSFTALGATGTQNRVPFETQTISAIEAIAQVGGLNSNAADPTGVFVFRNEPPEIANQVLARTDLQGAQRMVYVLDLTEPNGVFLARDFVIRDGDTVYVTEAPFTQFSKVLSAVTGTLSAAGNVSNIAQ